jgi:hypothetical protein
MVLDGARVYGTAEVYDEAKVYDDAKVYGKARVSGDAWVHGCAEVFDSAWVLGNAKVVEGARVYGYAKVGGYAKVSGFARVFDGAEVYGMVRLLGDACVSDKADYMVFKNTWSSGRWLTYTLSNKMWVAGCFYGTSEELIRKAYADSELSGKCYETIVRAAEAIEAAMGETK